jgi:hypothetical protein
MGSRSDIQDPTKEGYGIHPTCSGGCQGGAPKGLLRNLRLG